MDSIFQSILALIAKSDIKISAHGYDELAADGLLVQDVLAHVHRGQVIEEYPSYPKGPCVLILQFDLQEKPIHVLWGIPKGKSSPAVLITAYRPDPNQWSSDLKRRK